MTRFAPSFSDHIARYAFAMNYCYKRSVMDAGSKDGFGSQNISWVARDITLVDIDHDWLELAKLGHYACPASFVECNFEESFPEGAWDTIVAFEVIEHLANPEVFVRNVAKALNPGGMLVFSVPHLVANHEHKTLFDEQGIKDLISKELEILEFYIQDKKPISGKPMYKGLRCYVGVARKNAPVSV